MRRLAMMATIWLYCLGWCRCTARGRRPVDADQRLLLSVLGGRGDAVAAQPLDLVGRFRVLHARADHPVDPDVDPGSFARLEG